MQKKKILSLPREKNNSTKNSSNNDITSVKWTQLYDVIAGIKFEFISLKTFVIEEIRDIKILINETLNLKQIIHYSMRMNLEQSE